jgi:hypothetical protein
VEGCGRDTDRDGVQDYLDLDSDNDKLPDAWEDPDGDGLLGCCLAACNRPASPFQRKQCRFTSDGCGSGQRCEKGRCLPDRAFRCSEGQTDPRVRRTFDGRPDAELPGFICHPPGRAPLSLQRSKAGDWTVALGADLGYRELPLRDAGPREVAATIDQRVRRPAVAGFVVARPTDGSIQEELSWLVQALEASPPGGPGQVTLRASGIHVFSHDLYDSVVSTFLDLSLDNKRSAAEVRDAVVAVALGRAPPRLPPATPARGQGSRWVLKFTSVKRVALRRDKNGKPLLDASGRPVDSGDRTRWQWAVIGAVAEWDRYTDPRDPAGIITDDLSNGTALATHSAQLEPQCDTHVVPRCGGVLDVIWVVDESKTMAGFMDQVVQNAGNFFQRALSSGVDFRVAVAGMDPRQGGTFCPSAADRGRFLGPTEEIQFLDCLQNPPGLPAGHPDGLAATAAAVRAHLPREKDSPTRIRTNATLVIILVSDRPYRGMMPYLDQSSSTPPCWLEPEVQLRVDELVRPQLDLLRGISDPEAAAMFHHMGGTCGNACGLPVAHAYRYVARRLAGQTMDLCQKNLGSTLQVIIDATYGCSCPIVFDRVPISASVALGFQLQRIPRSRHSGFDFRLASNSLVLINVPLAGGDEFAASYWSWKAP